MNGRLGASEALYEQFLAPSLCALMFAPPEELSPASAALGVAVPLRVGAPGRRRRALVQRRPSRRRSSRRGYGKMRAIGRTGRAASGAGGCRRWSSGNRDSRVVAKAPRAVSFILIFVAASVGDRLVYRDVGDLRRRRAWSWPPTSAPRAGIASSPELREVPGPRRDQGRALHGRRRRRLFLDKKVRLPNVSNVFAGFRARRRRSQPCTSPGPSSTCARLHDEYATIAADPTDDVRAVVEVDMYNTELRNSGCADAELVDVALRDVLEARPGLRARAT